MFSFSEVVDGFLRNMAQVLVGPATSYTGWKVRCSTITPARRRVMIGGEKINCNYPQQAFWTDRDCFDSSTI
jgi:hypothetical protein